MLETQTFSQPSPAISVRSCLEGFLDRLEGVAGKALDLETFIRRHNPDLLRYEHVPRLVDVLQRVADTFTPGYAAPKSGPTYKRVIILEPPRYFKSEVASRLFHAYFLRRFPHLSSGIVSYSSTLAWELSSDARDYFEADGGALRLDTRAKRRWTTAEGGGLWAEGVGGSMLGKGFHVCTVDDPQDPQQAHSAVYQERFKHFWPQKFYSRREPGAAIILVMQRLALLDAAGWLFAREAEHPEAWHLVCCDAVRSEEPFAGFTGEMGLPPTCTLEPDPRPLGAVLSASRFSPAEVARTRTGSDEYTWDAQQQQRPGEVHGDFWRPEWFQHHEALPEGAHNGGKDWDTAYTAKVGNSASAYVETFRGPDLRDEDGQVKRDQSGNPLFMIYVEDCGWDWLEFPDLAYWMGGPKPDTETAKGIAPVPGPHYVEMKATGKSLAQVLRASGVPCAEVPVVGGDKYARAVAVQPRVSRGLISVNRRILEKLLRGERQGLLRVSRENLLASGSDLDLNDVFVQAINRHTVGRRHVPDAASVVL